MKRAEMLSVVGPVFKEEGNIPLFPERITPILERTGMDFKIIFSMDPSPDGTESVILERRGRDPRIKLLKFSRRIGLTLKPRARAAEKLTGKQIAA